MKMTKKKLMRTKENSLIPLIRQHLANSDLFLIQQRINKQQNKKLILMKRNHNNKK